MRTHVNTLLYKILSNFFTAHLQAIWPYSGHYHPTEENFREFISFLEDHNVDLTNVKVSDRYEEYMQIMLIKHSCKKLMGIFILIFS